MLEPVESSYEVTRSVIESRVRTAWVTSDGQLLTPVKFADYPKLESATGAIEQAPEGFPWLRVDIVYGEVFPTGIGQGTANQVSGFVQLTLFWPKLFRADAQNRPVTLGQFIGKARAIFDNYFGGGLVFEAAGMPVNNDQSDRRARVITCPFRFEECAN